MEDRDAAPRVEIVRGNPTEEDLAALAGVIPTAYHEEAAEATVDDSVSADTWGTSRRMRRRPGRAWGRFSGR